MVEKSNYQLPHPNIYNLATAELAPVFKIESTGKYAFLLHRNLYKSLHELAVEEVKLAGLRINPKTMFNSREMLYYKITLFDIEAQQEHEITGLPDQGKFCKLSWSLDSTSASLLNVTEHGLELYIINVASHHAVLICDHGIHAVFGNPVTWLDDDAFLLNRVPSNSISYRDRVSNLPLGPIIDENHGASVENRTFQDLLKDELDAHNFEYFATSEIWIYHRDGNSSLWKDAAMYDGISLSPDRSMLMISEIKKPFSYFVPFDRFPYTTYICDCSAQLIRLIVESPLIEYLPQGFMAVQYGIRSIHWRGDHPRTLVWVVAQDDGNPEVKVPYRDYIYNLIYPFDHEPMLIARCHDRFAGINFANDDLALIYERWWANRTQTMTFVKPGDLDSATVYNQRNYQDVYGDPGSFLTSKNKYGWHTLHMEEDGSMYLCGEGYSKEGRVPFIDKYNLFSKIKQRLYTASDAGLKEDILYVIDVMKGDFISILQAKDVYPNFYKRNFYTGQKLLIRNYDNPFAILQDIHKENIVYFREDGVELNATLYLPIGVTSESAKGLPMLMWAYPTEYKDKATAGQKTTTDNDFLYPHWSSPLYWVTQGFVVLDQASFPIIGEGDDLPNDTFLPQLIANAEAAIDAVSKLGYIDRNRVAIGGHSYGAFMVACLLTHTQLFAAGIARSGAYNRTLTPFGFQSEERNYWQARATYDAMNPFLNADKMKTPLLLIHGNADNNSGTYTMQTERYYAALKALGANVKMVLLPFESHSYAAFENIMHVLFEQDLWLQKWVKDKEITS